MQEMALLHHIERTLALIFLQFLLLKSVTSDSQPHYVIKSSSCTDSSNYTQNSVYQKNLNLLLLDFTAHASTASYHNSTSGMSPDIVYGMFYCRGDIDPDLCHDCVQAAAQDVVNNCTGSKEVVIWYQECTLWYANRTIFSLVEPDSPAWSWWFSKGNESNPDQFEQVMSTTMDSLITKAAYNSSYRGYATGEAALPKYQTLYCLVQCSPDIIGMKCDQCLRSAYRDMDSCCGRGRIWTMIFRPNCQMRYDTVPFYEPPAPPPPRPPSPLSPTDPRTSSSPTLKGIMYYAIRAVVLTAGFVNLLL